MTYKELYVEKYRPQNLDDMVIDPGIKKYFEDIFASDNPMIPNLLFRGRPGGGKTTLAKIIQKKLGWETLTINASEENGVDTMREKIVPFCQTMSVDGNMKLVILEEADGLSSAGGSGSSAQELLKNLIETSSKYVRFILLVNNISKIDAPIKSRMQEFEIVPPSIDESNDILKYVLKIVIREGIKLRDKNDLVKLVRTYYPDIRKILQVLQQCSFNEDNELRMESLVNDDIQELVNRVFSVVLKKNITDQDMMDLRAYYIENEAKFFGDYHLLMKAMFERLMNKEPGSQEGYKKKIACLRTIQEYMYRHTFVIDKEINFFAMLISLQMN